MANSKFGSGSLFAGTSPPDALQRFENVFAGDSNFDVLRQFVVGVSIALAGIEPEVETCSFAWSSSPLKRSGDSNLHL